MARISLNICKDELSIGNFIREKVVRQFSDAYSANSRSKFVNSLMRRDGLSAVSE